MTIKSAILSTAAGAMMLLAGLGAALADNNFPGMLGGIVAQLDAAHQPYKVVGVDGIKVFNDTMVAELGGSSGAAAPATTAFLLMPDLTKDENAAHDPSGAPVIAYDKDGMKLGSATFPSGALVAAEKAVDNAGI